MFVAEAYADDDMFEKKINMTDGHVSFYGWLPWIEGQLDQVPKGPAERRKPLASRKVQPEWQAALEKRYGAQAAGVQHAEACLKLRNTAASPTRKRFANSFRFCRSGDSALCAISLLRPQSGSVSPGTS